jgi:orotidine-5'-phosphate decarboxylase
VGLDPSAETLSLWGLDDTLGGLETFANICVEAASGSVGCIKPQVAFFERFGSKGYAVLEATIRSARAAGLLVIADAKRSDISTTAAAYGEAWLSSSSPLSADAVTVTPYLGFAALQPVFDVAAHEGAGVFVVVSSSNPEGRSLQQATIGRETVEESLYRSIGELNAQALEPFIGAVLGATRAFDHGPVMEMGGPLLVPGLGAQGATPEDVGNRFRGVTTPTIVAASRAWTEAGPHVSALVERALQLQHHLQSTLS